MGVLSVHKLASCIVCHAWNGDLSQIAVSPNTTEVYIFKASLDNGATEWEKTFVLKQHDQLVSGIDWAASINKIVTCSHDRNAYVWNFVQDKWEPTLVILRLNRAAIGAKWSPRENKFAVGSGAKTVCVCYYERENNWYVSKLIRKQHASTVTSVAWHPNNVLLATTSTDNKCRVFSAFVKGVDDRAHAETVFGQQDFGEPLLQLDAAGWVHGVAWSPSGTRLAFVAHDSSIHFVDNVASGATATQLSFPYLPFKSVLFLSETRVIGVGFDCNPALFELGNGSWVFVKFLDVGSKAEPASPTSPSSFSEALGKFHGKEKRGENIDAATTEAPSHGMATVHQNTVMGVAPLPAKGATADEIQRFSTSGLDGRIVVWTFEEVDISMSKVMITDA